jgi:heat shock protein HtpX
MNTFPIDPDMPAKRIISPTQYQPPAPVLGHWLFENQISTNIRDTYLLMVMFAVLLIGIVWGVCEIKSPIFAIPLAIVAAVVAFGFSFYSFYHSDELVLNMSHARPASKEEFPVLLDTLEGLTIAAGLPVIPRAYVIDDPAPNAFATGRDPQHSAIAVTTGLLQKMDRYQLEGVLAHELSHVANRDILLSTVAAIMVGAIVLLSDWALRSLWFGGGNRRSSRNLGALNLILMAIALISIILSPIIAQLLQLAISRHREFLADANAVRLTRYPEGLAGALESIERDQEPLAVANKATAHLYIVNPLLDHGGWLNSLFSTHPPIEERIRRLHLMG